ncbi:MAG: SDR family oxidoreductase [Lautropia sp.]
MSATRAAPNASQEALGGLSGKTLFITGASRGIGKAIALRAARDGANVVVAAKTASADPRLEGTIYTSAADVEAAGGRALPVILDVRDDEQILEAVAAAAEFFGGIDVLVNNASAIELQPAESISMKRYDLMMDINVRGAFACSKACLPYLKRSSNAHILTLSPPINLNPRWFSSHLTYTASKYAMSLVSYGLAHELARFGIASNALWPRTLIATAALAIAAPAQRDRARVPQVMADAAHWIVTRPAARLSGQFLIDEDVLRDSGVSDMARYSVCPEIEPQLDLFLDG